MVGGVPRFDSRIPLVDGNLMIVGDAARVLDSLSGAGISNALLSGQIAGEVAAKFIKGEADLVEYPRRFMRLKSRELRAYSLFKSIFVNANDEEFCRILDALDDFFPEKKVRDVNVPDIILKLVFRNLDLLKMARHLLAK
jgi:digeranylgeranylglycerophospholipid reductase